MRFLPLAFLFCACAFAQDLTYWQTLVRANGAEFSRQMAHTRRTRILEALCAMERRESRPPLACWMAQAELKSVEHSCARVKNSRLIMPAPESLKLDGLSPACRAVLSQAIREAKYRESRGLEFE